MYGIKKSDAFGTVLQKEICQVAVGQFDLQLNWGSGGLQIEGHFVYRSTGKGQEFKWSGSEPQIAAETVALLNESITGVRTGNNEVTFVFSNGDELTVYDDLKHEVLNIRNGNDPVIVV